MEEFRDIKDYEGSYQVSNLGRVKSLKFNKERILRGGQGSGGYLTVALRKYCKAKTRTIHQLVAESFLGHTPCGHSVEVDHIDEDKLNNRLDNLQLLSSVEHRGKGSSSEYTGVHWYKRTKKWMSQIDINGKNKNLGYFTCELEASKAYQKALNEII
tara:strand:- start:150 stop:620 length:471 start_codon:yes stop_codon:yes gene_type:complete